MASGKESLHVYGRIVIHAKVHAQRDVPQRMPLLTELGLIWFGNYKYVAPNGATNP